MKNTVFLQFILEAEDLKHSFVKHGKGILGIDWPKGN